MTTDADESNAPSAPSRFRPSLAASKPGRPDAAELKRIQRYNLALWRLSNGRGVPTRELAILTGLSEKAIRRRCDRAESVTAESEKDGDPKDLTLADAAYLRKVYGRRKDPETIKFLKRNGLTVVRPDVGRFDPELN